MQSNHCWVEGTDRLLDLLVIFCLMQPRVLLAFLAGGHTMFTYIMLMFTWFLPRLPGPFLQKGGPQKVLVLCIVFHRCSTFCCWISWILVNPFLQPVEVPLKVCGGVKGSHSPQFHVFCEFIAGAWWSSILMKMFNRTRSCTHPCGTLKITGIQLDFVPLTTST